MGIFGDSKKEVKPKKAGKEEELRDLLFNPVTGIVTAANKVMNGAKEKERIGRIKELVQ